MQVGPLKYTQADLKALKRTQPGSRSNNPAWRDLGPGYKYLLKGSTTSAKALPSTCPAAPMHESLRPVMSGRTPDNTKSHRRGLAQRYHDDQHMLALHMRQ